MKIRFFLLIFIGCCLSAQAQVGEYRSKLMIGANTGYVLSNVGFVPSVSQGMHPGFTAGLSAQYLSEKYFSTFCSIYAELNWTQMGWEEDIRDLNDAPVVNPITQTPEKYRRTLQYMQLPIMAHLAWGKEEKGIQVFLNAGPQIGLLLGESTRTNFEFSKRNTADRANQTAAQDTMSVEHKLDYGITAGLGLQYSHPKVGVFQLEGRYYYGLGNLYGESKRDFFGKSNLGSIIIKFSYLIKL